MRRGLLPGAMLVLVRDDIPLGEFIYRLIVDGRLVSTHLIFRGPLCVGDPFPLAEGGGSVTRIVRDGDDGSYEIHATPIA
jgi:hypothetical protein